jgi:hypothetical protein
MSSINQSIDPVASIHLGLLRSEQTVGQTLHSLLGPLRGRPRYVISPKKCLTDLRHATAFVSSNAFQFLLEIR